ncbi:hypothetical protein [Candidatus Similichlamydia epinepheli]|uniref:hypothetical protein n=1 Tax=Candidatus Similichlamydia epinepheli TaxID=1903953 RepID=UPI000D3CF11F|nr:hypothetical protein [Candidatus Similichlamydia epinepheli]
MYLRTLTQHLSRRAAALIPACPFRLSRFSVSLDRVMGFGVFRVVRSVFERIHFLFFSAFRFLQKRLWSTSRTIEVSPSLVIDSRATDPLEGIVERVHHSSSECRDAVLNYARACFEVNPHLLINPTGSLLMLSRGLSDPYWIGWLSTAFEHYKEDICVLARDIQQNNDQRSSTSIVTSSQMRKSFQLLKAQALTLFGLSNELYQLASQGRKRKLSRVLFTRFVEKSTKDTMSPNLRLFLVKTHTTLQNAIGKQVLNPNFLRV